ncbi:hypothetical protein TWF694_011255 [Orbilia ellipsospora]|uniref:Uncharacterized protein n=1 Tax=Orbilia ellipsospora TaxID=2528407 RepID=A0AAV9X8G9_9PEZI
MSGSQDTQFRNDDQDTDPIPRADTPMPGSERRTVPFLATRAFPPRDVNQGRRQNRRRSDTFVSATGPPDIGQFSSAFMGRSYSHPAGSPIQARAPPPQTQSQTSSQIVPRTISQPAQIVASVPTYRAPRDPKFYLRPVSDTFTTVPERIQIENQSKYPPATCHPQNLQRQPAMEIQSVHRTRYPGEKQISKDTGRRPFEWAQFRDTVNPDGSVSEGYLHTAIQDAMKLRIEQDTPRPQRRRSGSFLMAVGDEEAIQQNTAIRSKAMVKMIKLLVLHPKATKVLLIKLITDRRERYPDVLPYPVSKKWAWGFLVAEAASSEQEEMERQNKKVNLEMEVCRRLRRKKETSSTKEIGEELDTKTVTFSSKCTISKAPTTPSIGVIPPEPLRQNSMTALQTETPKDENKRDEPPRSGRKMRRNSDVRRSEREGSQIPLATFPKESKPKHRTLTAPKGILVTKTKQSHLAGSQPSTREIDNLNNPTSDNIPVSNAPDSVEYKGKSRMSMEEEIELIHQKKEELNTQIDFLRNIRSRSNGEGYIKERLEELETRKSQYDSTSDIPELGPETVEFESLPSKYPLSSKAKGLLTYGGDIILQGCGPSTPKFRKTHSLKIFGTEFIPPMQHYEFDSPTSSYSGSSSAASSQRGLDLSSDESILERPRPPDMIIISDYDRNHEGIEIPILPEPMEETTHWEGSSLVIPRGLEVTKVLAMLVVELQRCTAYIFSSDKGYEDNLWTERVEKLLDLVDAVRNVIPERQVDRPLCGSLLGEVGTLEMAANLGHGFWAMKNWIRDMENKVHKMEALILELGSGIDSMMKRQEKWIDQREKNIEEAGGDISADEEINVTNAELERYTELLQKTTKLGVESEEWKVIWREVKEVIGRMELHSIPFIKRGWGKGCRPDRYAPDVEHFTESVRGSKQPSVSIGTSRAIYPSKTRAKLYYRPGQVLMTELKIDALIIMNGMGGRNRSKVRRSILPPPVGSGRERMRLPEESWDCIIRPPNSAYPGRFLESNHYGLFTWLYPRENLKVFTELGLPFGRGCFRGKAMIQYRRPDVVLEQWQFKKWKSYTLKDFLSRETVLKLITSTAPPTTSVKLGFPSRPISPDFSRTPGSGYTSNGKVLEIQTIPDDGDDEEFIEYITDTGKQPESSTTTEDNMGPRSRSDINTPQMLTIDHEEQGPEPKPRVLRVMNPDIEPQMTPSPKQEEQLDGIGERQSTPNEIRLPLRDESWKPTTEDPEPDIPIPKPLLSVSSVGIPPTVAKVKCMLGVSNPRTVLLGSLDRTYSYTGLGDHGDNEGIDSE